MRITLTLLAFLFSCWFINIGLNGLYVLKKYFSYFRFVDKPLDFKFVVGDGYRLLGESTTWFGLIVAFLLGLLIGVTNYFTPLEGVVLGLGVYIGHALGSFIKRRLGFADGKFLPIVDHADSVFTAGVFMIFLGLVSWKVVIFSTFITIVLQPAWNYFWFRLGFRRNPL